MLITLNHWAVEVTIPNKVIKRNLIRLLTRFCNGTDIRRVNRASEAGRIVAGPGRAQGPELKHGGKIGYRPLDTPGKPQNGINGHTSIS